MITEAPTKEDRARVHALWADAAFARLQLEPDKEVSSRNLAFTVTAKMNDYATEHNLNRYVTADPEQARLHRALLPKMSRWNPVVSPGDLNPVLARDDRFTLTDTRNEYGYGRGRKVKFWRLTEKVAEDAAAWAERDRIREEEADERAEKRQAELAAAQRLNELTEEVADKLDPDFGTEDLMGEMIVTRYGPGGNHVLAAFKYAGSPFLSRNRARVLADDTRKALFADAVNAELKRRLEAE